MEYIHMIGKMRFCHLYRNQGKTQMKKKVIDQYH